MKETIGVVLLVLLLIFLIELMGRVYCYWGKRSTHDLDYNHNDDECYNNRMLGKHLIKVVQPFH